MRELMMSSELLGLVTAKVVLMALLVTTRSVGWSGRAELNVHSSSLLAGAGAGAGAGPPPRRSKLEGAGAAAGGAGEERDWNWKGLPDRELERAAKGSGFFCAAWNCCCCCWGEGVTECELGPESDPKRSLLAVCGGGGLANVEGMEG